MNSGGRRNVRLIPGRRPRRSRFLAFGYKLMISYLVFTLIPVAAVGYFAYQSSLQSIRKQTQENLSGTLGQMSDNVAYKSEEIKLISDQIFLDMTIQKLLRTFKQGWTSYDQLQNYVLPTLQNLIQRAKGRMQIQIYLDDESIPEIHGLLSGTGNPLAGGNRFDLLHAERVRNLEWYRALPWLREPGPIQRSVYRGEEYLWRQVEQDKVYGNISFIRRMVDFDRGKTIGLIRILVSLDEVLEAADYRKLDDRILVYVHDGNGELLRASAAGAGANGVSGGEPAAMLRIQQSMPASGWTMSAEIPQRILERDAKRVRNITLLVCLVSTVLLLATGMVISRYFADRVRKIVDSLNAFASGTFYDRIEYSGADEFAQIAKAFNNMSRDINELIHEVYAANIQKKEAELETLQAQINPHFLYNTLSSISRLARMGEIQRLHEMVMGLAKFYRLTLNEGKTHISVVRELEQAITYMDIQKIKHRDRVKLWTDIHHDVYGFETIKIILQPFLENALEHAFIDEELHIRLTASRDGDKLEFRIIDNGAGMTKEQLQQLGQRTEDSIGYGVRNVNERIKLQYGQAYGVEYGSAPGIGTSVKIVIPAVPADGRGRRGRLKE
jgi:two-component system sensor histidine kinase YesM